MSERDEIMMVMGEDGVFREYKEPFAVVECETEEDYNRLKELVEIGKRCQWISIKDRLPEERKKVLCLNRGGFYELLKWDSTEWGWIGENGEVYFETFVTHWMQLPELPKVQEGE